MAASPQHPLSRFDLAGSWDLIGGTLAHPEIDVPMGLVSITVMAHDADDRQADPAQTLVYVTRG